MSETMRDYLDERYVDLSIQCTDNASLIGVQDLGDGFFVMYFPSKSCECIELDTEVANRGKTLENEISLWFQDIPNWSLISIYEGKYRDGFIKALAYILAGSGGKADIFLPKGVYMKLISHYLKDE